MKSIYNVDNKQLIIVDFELQEKHWNDLNVVFAAALIKVFN